MPESVTDRPATAVEYVFLLSKSSRYYWDADAVRLKGVYSAEEVRKQAEAHLRRAQQNRVRANGAAGQVADVGRFFSESVAQPYGTGTRSRRNSDWFFESWQGLLLDEDDEPLALVVNPAGFKEAHFATFPPKLVEPMVKASTSERGVCAACGAPWARVVERGPLVGQGVNPGQPAHLTPQGYLRNGKSRAGTNAWANEIGWQPTCACDAGEPVPATVLDPFGGSGTVGLVADRLGRSAVLIDLKPTYVEMQERRLMNDAPLFVELESA